MNMRPRDVGGQLKRKGLKLMHICWTDIAQENINPIPLSEEFVDRFFEKHPNMAMYFQGVEMEDTSELEKRWRMTLSPESKANYPEDDDIGSTWVRGGGLPELDSRIAVTEDDV